MEIAAKSTKKPQPPKAKDKVRSDYKGKHKSRGPKHHPSLIKRIMRILHGKPKPRRRTPKPDNKLKPDIKTGEEEIKPEAKNIHRFNKLGEKVIHQIHQAFAPMSGLRASMADKLSHTPDLAVKAFGKGLHSAADLLRKIHNTPSTKRKYTKDHRELLHKILKVVGMATLGAAALSLGAPGLFLVTPDVVQGVYQGIPGGGSNQRSQNYDDTEKENQKEDKERTEENVKPADIDTHSEVPEENKTELEKKLEEQTKEEENKPKTEPELEPKVTPTTSRVFSNLKAALAYYVKAEAPKGEVDYNKLSDKDVVNHFIKLLTDYIRSGDIPKRLIQNAANFKDKT
jgi:hypothetical protein